jgi:hypothetical protein
LCAKQRLYLKGIGNRSLPEVPSAISSITAEQVPTALGSNQSNVLPRHNICPATTIDAVVPALDQRPQ